MSAEDGIGASTQRDLGADYSGKPNEDNSAGDPIPPAAPALVPAPEESGGGVTPPPEEVTEAIAAYAAPENYIKCRKPKGATSVIWDWGVKLQHVTKADDVKFACLGDGQCRDRSLHGKFVQISKTATSNATKHILAKHKTVSKKTVATRINAAVLDARVMAAQSPVMCVQDPARFMALTWVKCHVIQGFRPIAAGETVWERTCWRLTTLPDFPVTSLHREAVKEKIVELYVATTDQTKAEFKSQIGVGELLHLNLDLWVDKFSSLKYMGVRVFYITRNWELRSRLLSVRQFNPVPEILKNNRLSDLLKGYLETVLEEFHLTFSNIFSATSDSGSDVQRLCNVLLPGLWEWCICHMIDCALVEATGMQNDPQKSTNSSVRKVFAAITKSVEHVKKFRKDKAIFKEEQLRQFSQCTQQKLATAAPQRWCGVSGVLETILLNWETIGSMYKQEGKINPLEPWKTEITELYSLVKPCTDLIFQCQRMAVPTGQAALLGLAALKLTTLNAHSDLDILFPTRKLTRGGVTGVGGEKEAEKKPGPPTQLTLIIERARLSLRNAIDRLWFDKRYKSADDEDTDFLFDMQMAVHPTTADLTYIDQLASTPARAAEVKAKITAKLVALAVNLAMNAANGVDVAANELPAKRAHPMVNDTAGRGNDSLRGNYIRSPLSTNAGSSAERATTDRLANLGLFKKMTQSVDPAQLTLEDEVRAELKMLQDVKAGTLTADLSCEGILRWWRRWQHAYPFLARVARVIFGAPASAAVLERDFSDAGRMMTSLRSSADVSYVEMIMFLHGNLELIPLQVPELPRGENGIEGKIPVRLRNPSPGLQDLDGPFHPVELSSHDV